MNVIVIRALATLVALGATPAPPELPWLHGLHDVRVTDEPQSDVADRMPPTSEDLECATSATHGLALVADVAPSPGMETVLASYAQGIVVLDHDARLLASTPGYECQASSDELTALAVGRAAGVPTIALAITRGGHEEQTTELSLFRLGTHGRLDAVFTAEVEQHRGDDVRTGAVWLLPSGLIYQRPGGPRALWVYDAVGGAYVYRGMFELPPLESS